MLNIFSSSKPTAHSLSSATSQELWGAAQAQEMTGHLPAAKLTYEAAIKKVKEEIQKKPSDEGKKATLIQIYVAYVCLLQQVEEDGRKIKDAYEAAIKLAEEPPENARKKATLSNLYVQYVDFLAAVHQENEAAQYVKKALDLGLSLFLNNPLSTLEKSGAVYGVANLQKIAALRAQLASLPAQSSFFASDITLATPVSTYSIVENRKALLDTRHLIWHFRSDSLSTRSEIEQREIQEDHLLGAKEVLEEFIATRVISLANIQELVTLGALDDASFHRQITNTFLTCLALDKNALLDVRLLQGLMVMLFHRPDLTQDGQFAADCIVLLKAITGLLQTIVIDQNRLQIEALLSAVCTLLDHIVSAAIQKVDREQIYEPLLTALGRFKDTRYAHINWMATYAEQALLHVAHDSSFLEQIERYVNPAIAAVLYAVGGAFKIAAASMAAPDSALTAVIIAGFEPDRFLDALRSFKLTYDHIKLAKRHPWYIELRKIDLLIGIAETTGQFSLLGKYLEGKTKPYETPFLQGLCDRVARVACRSANSDVQNEALGLLKALSAGVGDWSKDATIQDHASTTLDQVAQWQNPDAREMDRVGYAPPGWHPFWASTPQSILLEKAQKKIQQGEILDAIPGQFTGLGHKIEMGFTQSHIDAMQNSAQLEALAKQNLASHKDIVQLFDAFQEQQKEALQPQFEPLALLGSDIERFKQDYKETLENTDQLNVLSMYVPLGGLKDKEGGKEYVDLEAELEKFFESEANVFLLLGSAGTGKSTFNRHIALKKLEQYEHLSKAKQDPPLIFFIELRSIEKPNQQVINQFFQSKGFKEEQIELLRTHPHQRCIFIFDGYDEIKERNRNFYQLNELWRWKNAKFVITSRPEYLDPNYQRYFHPQASPKTFQERSIAPFSAAQRALYIKNYVENTQSRSDWRVEQYEQAFNQLTPLGKELERPVVLRMLLQILPELKLDAQQAKDLTLGAVYEQYFQHWWGNWQVRLGEICLSSKEEEAKELIAESGGFVKHGLTYIQQCALALTKAHLTIAQNDEHFSDRHPETHKVFFKNDAQTRLLRFNAPFQLDQDQQYRFSHKTMQEYLVARAICTPGFKPRAPHTTDTINQLSIVQEPAILDFLVEQVTQQSDFKQHLYDWIEASKTQAVCSQGAANAITVLVRAEVQFNDVNLQDIRIPGADLSYGVFDSAQLQRADLSKTNLTGIWLRNADLTGARMDGVQFGELPSLQLENAVNACCYSPDGRYLVIATGGLFQRGKLALYEVETLAHVHTFEGHTSYVTSVAFSSDSQTLASGSWDSTVRLWSVAEKKPLHLFEGHTNWVESVAFSSDGQTLASGSLDSTVRLWSVAEKKPLHTFEGHTDEVTSVAFSSDGQTLASGSEDSTVRLWSVAEKKPLHTFEGHTDKVTSVAFSSDGQTLASGSLDSTVRLWSIAEKKPLHSFKGHTSYVTSVAFSSDGQTLASGSEDSTVRLWSVAEKKPLHMFEGHTDEVESVAFSSDGQTLASGSLDSTVRLWSVAEKKPLHSFKGHTKEVTSVAFSSDGQTLASGSLDKTVRLWSVAEKKPLHMFEGHAYEVESVAFSSDGQTLASGSEDSTVRLWSVAEKKPLHSFKGHTSYVTSVTFSSDGQTLASGSRDRTVRLWSVAEKKPLHTFEGHTDEVESVAFSSDGQTLASGSRDSTVRLWSVAEKKPLHSFKGHTKEVESVAFSSNGQTLASGSWDGTMRLWSVAEKKPLHTFEGHTSSVESVAFSSDGQTLASGCGDKTVRLWSITSSQCLTVIQGFNGPVRSVAWYTSAEGVWLATGSNDKVVRLWQVHRDGEACRVTLHWASAQTTLTAPNMYIQDVTGLSSRNTQLLKQRGATGEPRKTVEQESQPSLTETAETPTLILPAQTDSRSRSTYLNFA